MLMYLRQSQGGVTCRQQKAWVPFHSYVVWRVPNCMNWSYMSLCSGDELDESCIFNVTQLGTFTMLRWEISTAPQTMCVTWDSFLIWGYWSFWLLLLRWMYACWCVPRLVGLAPKNMIFFYSSKNLLQKTKLRMFLVGARILFASWCLGVMHPTSSYHGCVQIKSKSICLEPWCFVPQPYTEYHNDVNMFCQIMALLGVDIPPLDGVVQLWFLMTKA